MYQIQNAVLTVWHPHLIKDTTRLETIQQRTTRYVLSNQSQDYKVCLTSLGILSLMMQLELMNIILFVKLFKFCSSNFDIIKYFNFLSGTTRSSITFKLHQCFSQNVALLIIFISGDFLVYGIHYLPLTLTALFHLSLNN